MYALERGLGRKWMAVLFAVFTAIASFGIGNTVQANAIATLTYETYQIDPVITGLVIAVLIGLVVWAASRALRVYARRSCRLWPFST